MILVTGATGTIGRVLLDQLAATGAPLRAMTRHPGTADLPPGVEVVTGDFDDPASVERAVQGAEKVFLLTAGPEGPRHDATLATAAARAGVEHIVKVSSYTLGDESASDPITTWHRAGEQAVRESGVPFTFLRPTAFMSNSLMWADTIASHDTAYAPYGAGRTTVVDHRDIAATAATVLTTTGHAGRTYPLTGPEALSPGEQVAVLSDAVGRPLRYVETEPATVRTAMTGAGMPDQMADAVLALMATALEPAAAIVDPAVPTVTGRPATSFTTWAHDFRDAFSGAR